MKKYIKCSSSVHYNREIIQHRVSRFITTLLQRTAWLRCTHVLLDVVVYIEHVGPPVFPAAVHAAEVAVRPHRTGNEVWRQHRPYHHDERVWRRQSVADI